MIFFLLADIVLILHLAFVMFVVLGALLVSRWKRLIWIHPLAVFWGALTEFAGIVCPLTPLEVSLRRLGGAAGYEGGFIEHYLIALLYPESLTRQIQTWLGFAALLPNVLIYGWMLVKSSRVRKTTDAGRSISS